MLTAHRAERADLLIDPLARLLATPPPDVFFPEVVAVPARGVERWLTQQLSRSLGAQSGDGIAANILFPSPAQLVADVLAAALGMAPEDDPWASDRLPWTLLAVVDDSLPEPWCAVLAGYLGANDDADSHRRGRRYSTAATIAGLFTSYGDNRPAMLSDWAAGVDSDGAGQLLQDDLAWQPALWRVLRERIGLPSPAERLTGACARLIDEPGIATLPDRVSLFGPTRLPSTHLAVLEALAARRDVHLWLTHPSPALWRKLAGLAPTARRADDDTALLVSNPLLISLSRDIRELQQRLPATAEDIHYATRDPGGTILAKLQDDIRNERRPGPDERIPADGSISIHACYGPARQVEVLRESILHLLENDDTLEPRDIIVLCPDIDMFAPLVSAAFGQHVAGHPGQRLRVRLADRSLGRTNPLLEIAADLLRLADGRVTASEVLDLAAKAPVARQFCFTSEDQETLRRWASVAGARWGLFEAQRQQFGMAAVRQNTFSTARDRILLGVTSDESDLAWLGVTLPLDDVDSTDADLAGRFAEYIDRLGSALVRLTGLHPAEEWTRLLEQALDRLTDVEGHDAWQRAQASRELAAATKHACDVRLRLADVRALLASLLEPRPTRANFRTGEITVASLVPMRSVPHRAVALLGLDDDAFPRTASASGDNILARDPRVGERDPRSEDRQLLLDAVMSATEHLIVCFTGADPVTGERRPPAAPLADLIDAVSAIVQDSHKVVIRQPLQPFDPANFASGNPFSFDARAHAAAQAAQQPPAPARPFLPVPLPAVRPGDVDLDDLVAFLANPALAFLRQRLGITLRRPRDDVDNDLPVTLDHLEQWDIGDRMLTRVLTGASVDRARDAEMRRGTLPPGQLGVRAVGAIRDGVTLISEAALHTAGQQPTTIDVSLRLDGLWLTGTVTDVYGTTLIRASYTALSARHRAAAWVQLLAAAAATGTGGWQAVTIGRVKDDAPSARRSILTVPADPAGLLAQLVGLRDRGLAAPLPLAPRASSTYAARRLSGASPQEAWSDAALAWTSKGQGSWRRAEENNDDAIRFVYGPDAPLGVLCAQPTQQGEPWSDEPNRFAQLARHVWQPLLEHEQIGSVRP